MNDSAPPVASRRRRWTWRAGAGGAALIVGASLIILGPAGPSLAAHLAEGASVWRLGTLHVEGVGGSGLGDLRVKNATLSDAQGIWARAEDLRLQWKPLSLLLGQVGLKDLSAAHLRILRRPNLSPARGGGGVRFDTDLPAIGIADLDLADGVAGASARFSFAGAARTKDGALKALHLDLRRIDKPLDNVAIDYRTEGKLALDAVIDGAPGGVLANLARAPNAAIHVAAHAKDGAGGLDATLDRAPLGAGALHWDQRGWRGDGVLHLAALPAAADLAARLGGVLRFAGSGDALTAAGAPFQATVNSDVLEAAARGKLNNDAHAVGALALAVQGKNLPALARELDFSAGSARFDGAVEFEETRARISGRLGVSHAKRDGFDINGEGPVEVFVADKDVRFTGELGDGEIGAPDFLRRLTVGARLNVEGAYDRTNGAFRLSSFTVRSPHGALAGAGLIDDHVSSF
ncbi:MAG: hypothetical protein ABUS57_21840, partial [Pseudomonadota bacterium]